MSKTAHFVELDQIVDFERSLNTQEMWDLLAPEGFHQRGYFEKDPKIQAQLGFPKMMGYGL